MKNFLGLLTLWLICYFLYSIDDRLNKLNGYVHNIEYELVLSACSNE